MAAATPPTPDIAPEPGRSLLLAHCAIAFALLYSLWFSTRFTWRFEQLNVVDQYSYQANGLAHGHLYAADANGNAMACHDCSNYRGKSYNFYGPFPSLFQLVLQKVFRLAVPSTAIVWGVCAITLYVCFWLARWYTRRILGSRPVTETLTATGFVIVIATSDIFLHTAAVGYAWSQASATGALCILVASFLLFHGVVAQRPSDTALAGLCCGLAFLSKQNYLAAFVPGLVLLGFCVRQKKCPNRYLLWFGLPVAACLIFQLWFNWARFNDPLDSGMLYFNASESSEVSFIHGQLHRIPYNLYNHFLAGFHLRFTDFPFLLGDSSKFGGVNLADGSRGLLHNQPQFSMFLSLPMLLVLLPGFVWAVRACRKPIGLPLAFWFYLILLPVICFLPFLVADSSWLRYQYDCLLPAGFAALHVIILAGRWLAERKRLIGFAVFLGMSLCWQVAVGADQTLGLLYSRDTPFIFWLKNSQPADRDRQRTAQLVRAWLFEPEAPGLIVTDLPGPPPPSEFAGSTWFVRSQGALYRNDGLGWPLFWSWRQPVAALVSFPASRSARYEPLVVFGQDLSKTEALGVSYRGGRELVFRYLAPNTAGCTGAPVKYQPDRRYTIRLGRNTASQQIRVLLDGALVLECTAEISDFPDESVEFGLNRIGMESLGVSFSGRIEPAVRSPQPPQ